MQELLIGAGFALLIALLAWSDQILSLHKETIEAEDTLEKKRSLNWRIIKVLLRKKPEPELILATLNEMLTKESEDSLEDIQIIQTFINLDEKAKGLRFLNKVKYILVVILTFSFFIGGVATLFINSSSTFNIFGFTINHNIIPFVICVLFSLFILVYIVILNFKENNYRTMFIQLLEEI
jgi:uncharacterized membrane protein